MNKSEENKYIINTAVRFYRNVENTPFVSKFTVDDADDINYNVKNVCDGLWNEGKYDIININNARKNDLLYWCDENCCSIKTEPTKHERFIYEDRDNICSVITNEAEHIMVQAKVDEYDVNATYKRACETINALSERIPFAVSDKYGFLTANPWCSGTGLKVAVFMHMPASALTNAFAKFSDGLKTRGIGITAFYPDKRKLLSPFYHLTNLYTRNVTEEEVIENIAHAVNEVVEFEEERRSELIGNRRNFVYDIVYRSIGIMALAWELDISQFLLSMSNLRLAGELGIIDIDMDYADELPAKGSDRVYKRYKERNLIDPEENDDVVRARILREETAPILKKLL